MNEQEIWDQIRLEGLSGDSAAARFEELAACEACGPLEEGGSPWCPEGYLWTRTRWGSPSSWGLVRTEVARQGLGD